MTSNPVITGSLSLVSGNLLGSSVDTLMGMLKERSSDLTAGLSLNESSKRILDDLISIVLHVGLIGLGTHFVSNAFPWLSEEPSAFTLWIVGMTMSSNNLRKNLRDFNRSLSKLGRGEREDE